MDAIEDVWDRIHEWMTQNEPQMLNLLNPGATEEEMKILLDSLNLNDLPEDFKASYRIHNGSSAMQFFGSAIVNAFHSVEEIVADWSGIKDAHEFENNLWYERSEVDCDEIQNVMWSERWIPFGGDRQGNSICIDLQPTDAGKYGQVIQWFSNEEFPILCASSFTEFLTSFANDLENAKYTLSNDGKNLVFTEVDNK